MIVVFALIAAAFAGEQGARQERAAVVSYSGWPYAPSAYSAYPAVSTYSAWPANGYYGGYYGVPYARALW